jgi:ankyrin repeat protein
VVKELLNHNADIEVKDNEGRTPLILGIFWNGLITFNYGYILLLATRSGYIEMVKELLNHNANIEAKDNEGRTPLILGIFWNGLITLNYWYFDF